MMLQCVLACAISASCREGLGCIIFLCGELTFSCEVLGYGDKTSAAKLVSGANCLCRSATFAPPGS